MNEKESEEMEVAILAGGCFWCTEAVFSQIRGVEKVEPGYTGGSVKNPTYEEVSTGATGHAEAAQITFNPRVISFSEILEIFFATHENGFEKKNFFLKFTLTSKNEICYIGMKKYFWGNEKSKPRVIGGRKATDPKSLREAGLPKNQ